MKQLLTKTLAIATITLLAMPALSAGYIKFDGVDGESESAKPTTAQDRLKQPEDKPKALLLPAVQKATATEKEDDSPAKGKVESGWKVEEGRK